MIIVYLFVVLLVGTRGDVAHPLLVVEVPVDSLLDALFELQRGLPAQLVLQLG